MTKNSLKGKFKTKQYGYLYKTILLGYILFSLVYVFREELYKIDNEYVTLFIWTAPNLIPSFLFTLIGVFYLLPALSKDYKVINNTKFVWVINVINLLVFALIEYLHVIFKLGVWDNKDMIASLVGIIVATTVYFQIRKFFINEVW